ncbi:hypothetical protein [Haloarchaeobius sp. TZWWS8]|uniref:hypothetical protein n=1 Tax=Haloarchaeobius sp. TZWWS8 TaxID=3446121 RepID=UPI003EBF55A0
MTDVDGRRQNTGTVVRVPSEELATFQTVDTPREGLRYRLSNLLTGIVRTFAGPFCR